MQRVKEESQIIQTIVLENRRAGREACSHSLTFPAVEEREGKKISTQPRTAVQQTRKNEFPAGKQQNFPKATFARSSWPPPFHPHLICSAIQRSAACPLRRNPAKDALSWQRPPCPPQPGDSSRSGRRERSPRSSGCCKPVP